MMLALGILSVIIILAIFFLASRHPAPLPDRYAHELAIHRSQLVDIQTQVAHEGLTELEVRALTLEVQRRVLRTKPLAKTVAQSPLSPAAIFTLILLIISSMVLLYGWCGQPQLHDHPAHVPGVSRQAVTAFEANKAELLKHPDDVNAWLGLGDALLLAHESERAAAVLAKATQLLPGNVDLWMARGEVLIVHGGGVVSPAAKFAFEQAGKIDPRHPGPRLFLGLAYMRAGQPREALEQLQPLEKESPKDAPWLSRVRQMIAGCQAMLAASVEKTSQTPN